MLQQYAMHIVRSNPLFENCKEGNGLFPKADKNYQIPWPYSHIRKMPTKTPSTCSLARKNCQTHTRHQSDAIVPRGDGSLDVKGKRLNVQKNQ